jgi:hypothetical protein
MKTYRNLIIFILTLCIIYGFIQRQEIVVVRKNLEKHVTTAAQLGIFFNPANGRTSMSVTKSKRHLTVSHAKPSNSQLITSFKDIYNRLNQNDISDDEFFNLSQEFTKRMLGMEVSEFENLLEEIHTNTDINVNMREFLLQLVFDAFSNTNPESAFIHCANTSDPFQDKQKNYLHATSMLYNWIEDNPANCFKWIKENTEKLRESISDEFKNGLIYEIARVNPQVALQLVNDLDLEKLDHALTSIVSFSMTSEQWKESLSVVRGHIAGISDMSEKNRLTTKIFQSFMVNAAKTGFETGTQYIDQSTFTNEELIGFSGSFVNSTKPGEQSKWVEWIGNRLPTKQADHVIQSIINKWTFSDYVSAGNWLRSLPDGSTRTSAVQAYAKTIAGYTPSIAMEWAWTLPNSEDRQSLISYISQLRHEGDPK